jgi:ABC-2 type transport system permease protein
MNAWLNNTAMSLKLTLRDRQAIFWTYVFPIFLLFLFAATFGRGSDKAVGGLMSGLLTISAMSVGFFGLTIGLVVARERGILRRYHLTPLKPWMIISSEIAANFMVLISTLLLQLLLAKIFYGLRMEGSIVSLVVTLGLGASAFLALGFVIAGIAENVKAAQIGANLLFFPLMFLGGAAFPVQMLPPLMKKLSWLFPTRYLVEGLERIIVGGEGLEAIIPNLAVLALTIVAASFIATKLFRWDSREPLPAAKKAWVAVLGLIFIAAAVWQSQ